jgi:tetratricopeptide (TPR) repeat protein
MTDAPSEAKMRRGQLLRRQGRLDDAESFFNQAIADDPQDDYAYFELALCQMDMEGRRRDSLETIERAIALEPEYSAYHATRSMILAVLNRGPDALAAAKTAIELDPASAFAFVSQARAHLVQEQWSQAEQCARHALTLDADDTSAGNILAMALRFQGKVSESAGTVAQLLSDDPEDPMSHFNAGWSELQGGDHRKAEGHFLEALRLDPDFEAAREGLLESFRARSPIFRQYLRYCFFMQRFQQGARWAIIIGAYLAFRFGTAALQRVSSGAAIAFTFVYLSFVLWVWLAPGFGNLIVLLDRSARRALKRTEAVEGITVGGGLVIGGLLLLGGAATNEMALMLAGAGFVAGAIPASLTFTNTSRNGRILFGGVLLATYATSLLASLVLVISPETALFAQLKSLTIFSFIACLLCTWLGNIGGLRREAVQ